MGDESDRKEELLIRNHVRLDNQVDVEPRQTKQVRARDLWRQLKSRHLTYNWGDL